MAFNFSIRQIIGPSKDELDLGVVVMAKAFSDNTYLWSCVGHGNQDTFEAYLRATISVAAKFGLLYYAYDDVEAVVGVCGWFQPGHWIPSKEQDNDYDELYKTLPPELVDWRNQDFNPRYENQYRTAFGEEYSTYQVNNWYLHTLAVRPDQQRKGVAAALVKIGEDQARLEKKSVFASGTNGTNIEGIYRRLGYTVKTSGPLEHPDYQVYTDFTGKHDFKNWIIEKKLA